VISFVMEKRFLSSKQFKCAKIKQNIYICLKGYRRFYKVIFKFYEVSVKYIVENWEIESNKKCV